MKHTLKAIQTVAVSVPIILCSETSTQAENLPDLDSNPNSVRRSHNVSERDSYPERNRLIETNSQTAPDLKHNPTSTQSATQISYAPKNLDPSDSLLKLPTQASEVKIAIEQPIGLQQAIDLAIKNNPSLQEARLNLERSQKQRVGLQASYDVTEQLDDDANLTDGYSVGVGVEWDLFDGGTAKAQARQSETNIAINETQFANQRNAIRLEVEQGYFSLAANQGNITTSRQALELAEESLSLARVRFQSGEGTQTDVIQAQSELTTARGNYLAAIIDFNQSLNQLERAVASLPDNKFK